MAVPPFRINRTQKFTSIDASEHTTFPLINSQVNANSGLQPGAMGYDTVTERPYYSKGDNVWTSFLGDASLIDGGSGVHKSLVKDPETFTAKGLAAGSGIILSEDEDNITIIATPAPQSGTTRSFSFIKSTDQTVSPSSSNAISNWSQTPSPPYHDDTNGWNFLTGRFTALNDGNLLLNCGVSWKQNVSNLGTRCLQIYYTSATTNTAVLVKQSFRQASPSANVKNDQEISAAIKMLVGDYVEIRVSHDTTVSLVVSGGEDTGICGVFLIS